MRRYVQPEQEDIVVANRLANLDIGAMRRTDGHRSFHHRLHIAGAGGLFACA